MEIYERKNFLHENFPIYGTKEAYVGGRRGEIERQTETDMQERGEEREEEGGEGREGENRQTDRQTDTRFTPVC